jgi:hypothetical protein
MSGKPRRSVKKASTTGPHFEKLVQVAFAKQERKTSELRESIRASERLSEKDYSVRINARD